MKKVDIQDDKFLTTEFPDLALQISHVGKGVSSQKPFFKKYSKNFLYAYWGFQVTIIASSAIATLLAGLEYPKGAIYFTTLTLVLTSVSSVFDFKSEHLRTTKALSGLAKLQDEIYFSISRELDNRASGKVSQIVSDKTVSGWSERLDEILRESHEKRLADIRSNSEE